ncbi:MAG: Tetracycline resistance protein, class C [Verrucomicrobia subdivision 3 bacterium]|nr:Tetracycline resistance protein, class C [Limisphaerales bacterium]MCS1416988.1 Tetracycline resistance protein, class C [Limisphaerales bacterium]
MKKPSLLVIFLTVFIDLIGFGLVLPLLPRYADRFGAPGWGIGLIISSYSIMQFFFTPWWGKLSDQIGRRPVILVSTTGSTISYVLFALASGMEGASGLWMLLVSRVFAGIAGANLSVASAYIADVTTRENRSKGMGLIGVAFGLGFMIGPAIGAFSAKLFGLTGPGWVAAAICGTNFILACAILAESRKSSSEPVPDRPKFDQWLHTLRQPRLGFLIGVFFLAAFCFACFETTLSLLLGRTFQYDETRLGYLFAYCGLISILVQGVMGRLVRRFGEPGLICTSLVGIGVSLALLPFMGSLLTMLMALGLYTIFSSINRAPTMGMISMNAPENEQGNTLGVAQSAGTLARIFGPIFAAWLYSFRPALPYVICAGVAVVAAVLAWFYLIRGDRSVEMSTANPA